MYGMIHKAAEAMSREVLGDDAWATILERSGLSDGDFISGQYYSDEQTFNLVGIICDVSGLAAPDLLHAFGKYWVGFAAQTPYGGMIDMAGDSLAEFLESLDSMHASIKSTMPEAVMPYFEVIRADDTIIEVAYRSERDGLQPFVAGLFDALLERFGESGAVSFKDQDDHVLYTIDKSVAKAA